MALIVGIIHNLHPQEVWWGAPSILDSIANSSHGFKDKSLAEIEKKCNDFYGISLPLNFAELEDLPLSLGTITDSDSIGVEKEDISHPSSFQSLAMDTFYKKDSRKKREKQEESQEETLSDTESSDSYVPKRVRKKVREASDKKRIQRKSVQKISVDIVLSPLSGASLQKNSSDFPPIYVTGESFFCEEELGRLNALKSDIAKISNEIKKEKVTNRLVQAMIYCYMAQTVKFYDEIGFYKYELRNNPEGSLKYLTREYVIHNLSVLNYYFKGYEKVFPGMASYCYALINGVKFPLKESEEKYCEENFQYR